MRRGDGSIDTGLLNTLINHRVPMQFDTRERNVTTNDWYAQRGRAIISGEERWKGRLLSDILKASSFTITHDALDGTSLTEPRQTIRLRETYEIDDAWKRGFEISIGVCDGLWQDDAEQQRVKSSLVGHAKNGFDAGQEVQFNRTNPLGLDVVRVSTTQGTDKVRREGVALPGILATDKRRSGLYMPKSARVKELFEPSARMQEDTTHRQGMKPDGGDRVAIENRGPGLAHGVRVERGEETLAERNYPRLNRAPSVKAVK
jgi:hypothetical protein